MRQGQDRTIVLDSCVVIDLIEKPAVARKIRSGLRDKPAKIVLCDQVLREVQRIRRLKPAQVLQRTSGLLGRTVEFVKIESGQRARADDVSYRFQMCHRGDNLILSLCQARDFILVTFDRMLLKTCEFLGVPAFHPLRMGGI